MPRTVFVTSTTSAVGTPNDSVNATPRPRSLPRSLPQLDISPTASRILREGSCQQSRSRSFNGSAPGGVDQLIEKAVVQEAVAGRADRAPRTDRHQLRHTIARNAIVRNLERLIPGTSHNGNVRPWNRQVLSTELRGRH